MGPDEPLARQQRCGSLVHDGHYPHPATRGLASDVRPSRGLQARAERFLLSKPCSRRTPSPMTPSDRRSALPTALALAADRQLQRHPRRLPALGGLEGSSIATESLLCGLSELRVGVTHEPFSLRRLEETFGAEAPVIKPDDLARARIDETQGDRLPDGEA